MDVLTESHIDGCMLMGNLKKATAHNFQCQVRNRNLKDAEIQTKISITL